MVDRTALDVLVTSMAGRDGEQVFRELRERGKSPVETTYVASRVLGLSTAEAKAALFASDAWRDRREDWVRLHDEVAKQALQR
ncbi:hypothetical protein [Saccharothrix luteola]|uniref:hypothetical protein n=1 Tax=Saccharothrix luteola TaxID=2893018 RepID=UPI001E3E529C|nr:hypothetical protein [Saccharothrix luteola]MCC8244162.1 hypothetical protein [Saccharothrix luteola]MCC8250884.1 hypothetical protein [Saccharothrix luteola]